MDQRDLSAALRRNYWPRLRDLGFRTRTDRAAWRDASEAVDVVDIWTVGQNAIACGCTPVSISAMVGSIPSFMPPPPAWTIKTGMPRPRYPDCHLKIQLTKQLVQPWFSPFASAPSSRIPRSFATHLDGLRSVIRHDRHDRSDIWYVKDDGSNLDEVLEDLWRATSEVGLPMLDRFHDPCAVIRLVTDAVVVANPDSPVAHGILDAARGACGPA